MRSILEHFNLFGYKISFNFNKSRQYHSYVGIVSSMILYVSMIYLIFYFSQDFINKSNPRLNYKETEFNEEISVILPDFFKEVYINLHIETNKDNLEDYFSLSNMTINDLIELQISIKNFEYDENTPPFNDQLSKDQNYYSNFQINLTVSHNNPDYLSVKNNKIILKTKIFHNSTFNMIKINDTYFNNGTLLSSKTTIKRDLALNDLIFPIKKNTAIDYLILINEKYKLNQNIFNKNIEEVKSNTVDDLDYFVGSFFRRFEIVNQIIDVSRKEFFKNYTIQNQFSAKNVKLNKTFKMRSFNFEVYKVKDDLGIVFTDFLYNLKFRLKETLITFPYIYKFYPIKILTIKFDGIMKNYERIYKKLQNIFADLGGIFSSMILILRMIFEGFSETKFNYDAINHIFKIDEVEFNILKDKYIKKKYNKKSYQLNNPLYKNYLNDSSSKRNKKSNRANFYSINDINNEKLNDDIDSSNWKFNEKKNLEKEKQKRKGSYENKKAIHHNNIDNKKCITNKSLLMELSNNKYSKEENIIDKSLLKRNGSVKIKKNSNIHQFEYIKSDSLKKNLDFCYNEEFAKKLKNFNKHNEIKISNYQQNEQLEVKSSKTFNLKQLEDNRLNEIDIKYYSDKQEFQKKFEEVLNKIYRNKNNIDHHNKEKLVKLTKFEIFKIIFCCRYFKSRIFLDKEEIFLKAQQKISEYLDILHYFKFNENFERLKSILFNENQKIVFDFLRKRTLSEIIFVQDNEKIYQSIQYFIEKNENWSFHDKNINKLLNHEMVELFV